MESKSNQTGCVSIIMVNYNSTQLLIEAIQSVVTHTHGISYEIIIVDNASPDNGADIIEAQFGEGVKLIRSTENRGFGAANNIGIANANGTYLFLLNPDTLLRNNAVLTFYQYCESHQQVPIGALGCILTNEEREPINSFGRFLTPARILSHALKMSRPPQFQLTDEPFTTDFITGADLFIPRRVIETIGDFDPAFFMYCEEADLQYRMAQAGFQRIIIPGPQIIHFDGGSYQQRARRSALRRYQHDRSRCLYIRKHYPLWRYLLFRVAFFVCRIPALINPHYDLRSNFKYFLFLISMK